MSSLTAARYGKDKVRVFRVVREGDKHSIVEYNVRALLEGNIATSYTQADNSVVVATDSIKNTCYVIVKSSPHVLSPELYGLHLGTHFVTKYPHIHKAFITIEQLKWSRITVEGTPHKHSFVRDGEEKIVVNVEVDATAGKDKVSAKVDAVLKSSGSAFEGFIRDEYTTLRVDVDDRIFSTSIDLDYSIKLPDEPVTIDGLGAIGEKAKFSELQASARKITLETFATDESASVQATMYKMSQQFIADNATANSISYRLPNKHYIPVPLDYIGLANSKPKDAEVFCPVEAPRLRLLAPSMSPDTCALIPVTARTNALSATTLLGAAQPSARVEPGPLSAHPHVTNDIRLSDLLKRHEKKMHSTVSSTTSTPTTTKNKFDAHLPKAPKRPQPFPYVDSGTTSVASGSGGDISASASGSGSGSGVDSVPTVSRHTHNHKFLSDSGSNSDSRSRSRSLSPLRRQEQLQDQDELISSDDGGPTNTKYRRLSDPSGASRMDTDSRKSPSPSATSSRTFARTHPPYNRHNVRETPVLTSSMHGTESVRVCRVIRNEGHHFIVEYAISAMLEGTRPSASSRVAPVPIKDTCYVLAKTSPHVLSPELFGLHIGAHLVGTHVHVRAARIVIQQVKWGRIPVRGRLHASTFLRDGEEKRSVTIDVRREAVVGPEDDKDPQDVVMAEVRSSIQGLVVMKTVVVRNGYSRDECTNVNEHDDGVYCAQMDVEYLLGLPRVPLRIEDLAALGESMRFTDVAQRVRDMSLEVFATDEDEDVQATMHRMSREVLDGNPTIVEVTYRMPNRHYIPVPLDYIGLQNTKAREAEVFCPVDAPR
ncbi:unnamed protein product [Rhizoctonia solani]|uniref:factor independent urate hydroxylase n=1 Tax=Rhizoctonia solani TaxID=456999 RepID=A0A8H2XEX4_9AGAM|nr:unnamed protein product [Rhizoctonia solani]